MIVLFDTEARRGSLNHYATQFVIQVSVSFFVSIFAEYTDDAQSIPKNTSVLVRRVPARRQKPIVAEVRDEYCLLLLLTFNCPSVFCIC